MLTGSSVAEPAARGKREDATRFLEGIHWANVLAADGKPWSFPEYVHGRDHTAGGTISQGWSAAAAVIARHALEGKPVFRVSPR